jgi:hypothetical protein
MSVLALEDVERYKTKEKFTGKLLTVSRNWLRMRRHGVRLGTDCIRQYHLEGVLTVRGLGSKGKKPVKYIY